MEKKMNNEELQNRREFFKKAIMFVLPTRGMTKHLFVLILFVSALAASAQDVIVKKDGSTILSKVMEVGTTEIKYKKWNNQEGPMYTIEKANVQSINYEKGDKEIFTEIETPQSQQLLNYNSYTNQMAENIAASNRLQKEKLLSSAKAWHRAGSWIFGISLAGGIITGLCIDDSIGDPNSDGGTYWLCGGVGFAVGLGGMFICQSVAQNKEKLANTIVSSHIIQPDFNLGNSRLSAGIDLISDKNIRNQTFGIGLCLNF